MNARRWMTTPEPRLRGLDAAFAVRRMNASAAVKLRDVPALRELSRRERGREECWLTHTFAPVSGRNLRGWPPQHGSVALAGGRGLSTAAGPLTGQLERMKPRRSDSPRWG